MGAAMDEVKAELKKLDAKEEALANASNALEARIVEEEKRLASGWPDAGRLQQLRAEKLLLMQEKLLLMQEKQLLMQTAQGEGHPGAS